MSQITTHILDTALGWLRDKYAALTKDERAFVDSALAGTGCESLVG